VHWSPLLASAAILGGVGVTFGTLIAIANRTFWVWEDPRIDAVTGMLPGANCGACGQAGCRAFAELLVAGRVAPAECTVMGSDDVDAVASLLGVEAGEAHRRVARLKCGGGCDVTLRHAAYHGLSTCSAANTVAAGGMGCVWGCLGLGDCERSCDFDAITMNAVDLPVVDPVRCTACGDCVEACPRNLFELLPADYRLYVQCSAILEGDAVEALCAAACTACGKCAMDAPGVIEMVNGLPVIDYSKNELANRSAIARCPTGAIVWLEGSAGAAGVQFTPKPDHHRHPVELV
jgi:H+/Na+-translocating ferredoxin:NAD+ oxidoreductase subunit B